MWSARRGCRTADRCSSMLVLIRRSKRIGGSAARHPPWHAGVMIRDYRESDVAALRECVIALQEFERLIDPRLREGEAMADQYCEHIHHRCREAEGRVFVAEDGGLVAEFVAALSREAFTELDEPPGYRALVTDLVVLAPYRCGGIGRQLLQRAEAFAREAGAGDLPTYQREGGRSAFSHVRSAGDETDGGGGGVRQRAQTLCQASSGHGRTADTAARARRR